MYEVYWGCLIGGIVFGLFSLIAGDGIADALDGVVDGIGFDGLDFLHPMTILSAIVLFGGAGILLTDYTKMSGTSVILVSAGTGVAFSILAFFIYVRPMRNTESSLGYSVRELVGRTAEVSIPIPAGGHGQVSVRIGSQIVYHIAESYDGEAIREEVQVVIVQMRDGIAAVLPEDL